MLLRRISLLAAAVATAGALSLAACNESIPPPYFEPQPGAPATATEGPEPPPACLDGAPTCVCPTDDDACRNRKVDALLNALGAARNLWPEPAAYAFDYAEEGRSGGPVAGRVTVTAGVAGGPAATASGSMSDLFLFLAGAMEASRCGPGLSCLYDRIEVAYDPALGYPTRAEFVYGSSGWSFTVSDVTIAAGPDAGADADGGAAPDAPSEGGDGNAP